MYFFRFQDLPLEVRNKIYDTCIASDQKTKTALLTTSKRINFQVTARDTLSFTACFVSFRTMRTFRPHLYLTVTGEMDYICTDPINKEKYNIWPQRMLEVPRVEVCIFLQDNKPPHWSSPSDFFPVYNFVYSIGRFLSNSTTKRQRLRITFISTDEPVTERLTQIKGVLDEVSKLRNNLELVVSGIEN